MWEKSSFCRLPLAKWQVLKSYLKAKYQNLITVDLYCNYTPSPVVMRKYLEESYGKENIDSVEFRIKDEGLDR